MILEKGSQYSLPCTYNKPVSSVMWSKGSTFNQADTLATLIFTDGHVVERANYKHQIDIAEDFSLIFKNVAINQEGRYFCAVSDFETENIWYNHTDVTVLGSYTLFLRTMHTI